MSVSVEKQAGMTREPGSLSAPCVLVVTALFREPGVGGGGHQPVSAKASLCTAFSAGAPGLMGRAVSGHHTEKMPPFA